MRRIQFALLTAMGFLAMGCSLIPQLSQPAAVDLGSAGNYVILAKAEVTSVPSSVITGDVGLSPAATSFLHGFSLTDATGYATSAQVTGHLFASDMADPTPANLTTAVSDMETAYTDAAGRTNPRSTNLGAGTLSGLTLYPGLYTWGSTVNITTDITLSGTIGGVWIFQISGDLTVSSAVTIHLRGGALASNVFWQVAGVASLGTTSHFEGIILSQTAITLKTEASMNGRALAQTNVTLEGNTLTEPVL